LVEGAELSFNVVIYWAGVEEDLTEQVGWLTVVVPAPGTVSVVTAEVVISFPNGSKAWTSWKAKDADNWPSLKLQTKAAKNVRVMEFAGSAQVSAYGGVQALRGKQRAFQLATEDIMLSFFMYLPVEQAPAPLLVFFHGDLTRDLAQCIRPGLADFCDTYGPALICKNRNKEGHAARRFVVVTPCSPAEYWWFRYPAEHDSSSYVPDVELWFRRLTAWVADNLSICHRVDAAAGHGMRLSGQSMGGYAALELARAMPQLVSAIGVGAPCFDACRLDWLADRLQNVPTWILIGRADSMCAYEECASLVLKMRDRGALLARISSVGIKGHNEACGHLEKDWLYQWLLDPLVSHRPMMTNTVQLSPSISDDASTGQPGNDDEEDVEVREEKSH